MKSDMTVFKAETAYNSLTIETSNGVARLLGADQTVQSIINLQSPEQLALKNLQVLMGVLLFMPTPQNICLLGTGAGSLLHFLRHHYPQSRITALEIDGELLELMQAKVHLPRADDKLTYVIDDAAHFINSNQQIFDLIIVDIFIGSHSPEWLYSLESMQALKTRMSNVGGLAYNLLIDDEQDFTSYYRNLRQVFNQQTLCLPIEGLDNTIAYAFKKLPTDTNMTAYLQKAQALGEAQGVNYLEILSLVYRTNPSDSGVI